MERAAAVVTDHGGRTAHAAIVSREIGIPAVVGTGNGTQVLRDGDLLADAASVQRLRARMDRKLASGYNLFTLLRHQRPADWVGQLLVGSVGTLGIITRATLRAEPYQEGRATTLIYFRSLREAGDAVLTVTAKNVALDRRTLPVTVPGAPADVLARSRYVVVVSADEGVGPPPRPVPGAGAGPDQPDISPTASSTARASGSSQSLSTGIPSEAAARRDFAESDESTALTISSTSHPRLRSLASVPTP